MRRALAVVVTASQAAASPRVVLCVLLIVGSTCAIVAVYELAGSPGALLTAAAICFVLAKLLLRGLDNDV
jgi:uncharacterized membrane protein